MKPGIAPASGGGRALAALFAAVVAAAALPACRRNAGYRVTREGPTDAPGRSPAPDGAREKDPVPAGASLTPAEARAVRSFLAGRPSWRLASDADARPSDDAGVSQLYGVYHPYVVRGDIDDDGTLDFVVAFVDRENKDPSPGFSVVAFCGDGHGAFRPPQLIESEIALEAGDISIDRDSIVITPDLSEDDTSRRYRWNPHRRRFDFVADDDASPDRIPSARV